MLSNGFIPGVWEEEINVDDFLNLNKKQWSGGGFSDYDHELSVPSGYDVISDKQRLFKYLSPFIDKEYLYINNNQSSYIEEEIYSSYVSTSESRKMIESGLVVESKEDERTAFFQPDIASIPLYGTRYLIKERKNYLKELDKQFQSNEWLQRKIEHHQSINSLYQFESFASKHKINVKKPAKRAKDVANYIWLTSLYAFCEKVETPFTLYSVLSLLDIYIERDIQGKEIEEVEAQRIVDELYCKVAALKELINSENKSFGVNLVIASGRVCKTTYRIIKSAERYDENKMPFQLVLNSSAFPNDLLSGFQRLFGKGHTFSLSKSMRKRDKMNLSITPFHTFFQNHRDVTLQLGSIDMEKLLMISINGGRDVDSDTKFHAVKRALPTDDLNFDTVIECFEEYLTYFLTSYVEYMNAFAYYYDYYHSFSFRRALITDYPHYLLHVPFHHISGVINILTAIYEEQFEIEKNDKGYIEKIVTLTNKKEEFVCQKINDYIHQEIQRLLFYKNGRYSVVFFSDLPFFKEEDDFGMDEFSPFSLRYTSFSGFQSINDKEFKNFMEEFKIKSYTHVRIQKE